MDQIIDGAQEAKPNGLINVWDPQSGAKTIVETKKKSLCS